MNLTDSEILKFQMGEPLLFEDICAIYPATLRQIISEGYDNFQTYLSVITAEKPVIKPTEDPEYAQLLNEITDFQYIIYTAMSNLLFNQTLKKAFRFFTHSEITFSLDPEQIIIGPVEEKHLLTESKFYDFQRIIKRMYFLEQEGEEIIIYEDDSPAVKRLKMQMRANREKVRKAKAAKARQEKTDMQLSDLIGSMTINDCGLNMNNIWDITYYAFHDQLKRMGWRDQFNINNSAALAGAKLKKSQLKHWMRSIADSDKS